VEGGLGSPAMPVLRADRPYASNALAGRAVGAAQHGDARHRPSPSPSPREEGWGGGCIGRSRGGRPSAFPPCRRVGDSEDPPQRHAALGRGILATRAETVRKRDSGELPSPSRGAGGGGRNLPPPSPREERRGGGCRGFSWETRPEVEATSWLIGPGPLARASARYRTGTRDNGPRAGVSECLTHRGQGPAMIRPRGVRPPTSAPSIGDRCGCDRRRRGRIPSAGRRAGSPAGSLPRLRVRFSFARPSTHRSPGPAMLKPHLFRHATSAVSRRDKCGCDPQRVQFRTMTNAAGIATGAGEGLVRGAFVVSGGRHRRKRGGWARRGRGFQPRLVRSSIGVPAVSPGRRLGGFSRAARCA